MIGGRRLWLVLLVLPGTLFGQAPSPTGLWTTIDDHTGKPRAQVRIVESDGSLEGTIVKIFPEPGEEPNPRCTECTDARRGQPVIGMTFLSGLRRASEGAVWTGGTILDPDSGRIYRSQATLSDDGRELLVRGFIGIALLGRTQTWVRAEP
jgi:uncharacterized protein (DUF2147 family)